MRVRYLKRRLRTTETGEPCHFEIECAPNPCGLHSASRDSAIALGFTCVELNTAEASPGDWIDCPRDEPARPKQHCRCCVVLTRGRDALLTVCKKLRRGDLPEREQPLWDEMQTAIAIAEPTE